MQKNNIRITNLKFLTGEYLIGRTGCRSGLAIAENITQLRGSIPIRAYKAPLGTDVAAIKVGIVDSVVERYCVHTRWTRKTQIHHAIAVSVRVKIESVNAAVVSELDQSAKCPK